MPPPLPLSSFLCYRQDQPDAIDRAIVDAAKQEVADRLADYRVDRFVPFNPVDKKTIAHVTELASGRRFKVSKGAPTVIRNMSELSEELEAEIDEQVEELASRGLRALGLAISEDMTTWNFIGASVDTSGPCGGCAELRSPVPRALTFSQSRWQACSPSLIRRGTTRVRRLPRRERWESTLR